MTRIRFFLIALSLTLSTFANAQTIPAVPNAPTRAAAPRWRIVASRYCSEWRDQDVYTTATHPGEFSACDSWFDIATLRFIDPATRAHAIETPDFESRVTSNPMAASIDEEVRGYIRDTFGTAVEMISLHTSPDGEWVMASYAPRARDSRRMPIVSRVFLHVDSTGGRRRYTRDAETHPINESSDRWGAGDSALFISNSVLVAVHDNGADIWQLDGSEMRVPTDRIETPSRYSLRPTPDPIRASIGRAEREAPLAWASRFTTDSAEFNAGDLRTWAHAVTERYVQHYGRPWAKAWIDAEGHRHLHGHWRMDGCERSISDLRIDEVGEELHHTLFNSWPDGVSTRRYDQLRSVWIPAVPPNATTIRINETPTVDPSVGM